MKKIILFTIIVFLLASCSSKNNTTKKPLIEKGVLDLSKWDFKNDGPIELNGEWEFYWKKLLDPQNYDSIKSSYTKSFIKIPGTWEQYPNPKNTDGKNYEIDSYATYVVKIIGLNEKLANNLAVNVDEIYTSYKLFYIPGSQVGKELKPLLEIGKVGKNKSTSVPAYSYKINILSEIDETNYLIVQAANYTYRKGGIRDPLKLGLKKDLIKSFDFDRYVALISIGIIFMMSLYHIVLYTQRRGDRGSLFFAIFCFLIVIRRFIIDNIIDYAAMSSGPLLFEMLRKIEYFTSYVPIPALFSFMISIFHKEFSKLFEKVIWGVCFIFCITVVVFDYRLYCQFLKYYQVFMLIVAIYGIISLIRSIINKREGALISMSGYVVFILMVVNDVLSANGIISTVYLIPVGVIFLIFSQSFIIARLFAKTHRRADRLNVELQELNTNLESKVEERTSELQAAMDEMEAINNELVNTRDALWGEMQIARKIQTVLVPEDPQIPGYDISAIMTPADEVGGDYYDVINVGNINWVVIGDVSGHGVPAGLIMMMVQTAIHSVLAKFPEIEPADLLTTVNETIAKNIERISSDKYMTITVFSLSSDGTFVFSGLHQDIIIYRETTSQIETVPTDGMWLGMLESIEGMLNNNTFKLNTGDVMLLFTDGITEAWKKDTDENLREFETMFGESRLKKILEENRNSKPGEIIKKITNSLQGYIIDDDVTMMVIKRIE